MLTFGNPDSDKLYQKKWATERKKNRYLAKILLSFRNFSFLPQLLKINKSAETEIKLN